MEENNHSCNVSYAFNNHLIIKLMKNEIDFIVKKIWSDDCLSHFLSQYVFYMMGKFGRTLKVQQNYFEVNHDQAL